MILGFSRPASPTFSVDLATLLTDVRLGNGKPAQVTRYQWPESGSPDTPATSDYIDIRVQWPAEQPIGLIALLGLSFGADVRIVVTGRRSMDSDWDFALGGNATTQDSVARSDGRARHIVIPTATDALVGVQWRIYNDQGGVTWADGSTTFDIGEAVAMRTEILQVKPGWQDRPVENSELSWTLGSQPHTVSRRNRRERSLELVPQQTAAVRGQGLTGGKDWARIDAAMAGYEPIMSIPHWLDDAGAIDAAELHETALFGIATDRGGVRNLQQARKWYERPLTFSEAPEA